MFGHVVGGRRPSCLHHKLPGRWIFGDSSGILYADGLIQRKSDDDHLSVRWAGAHSFAVNSCGRSTKQDDVRFQCIACGMKQ